MSRATKRLQREILARFEEIRPQPPPKKKPRKVVTNKPPITKIKYEKTNLIELLEIRHQQTIEQLIWGGSITEVADLLGVGEYTVTRWRRVFPIEYQRGKNNRKLPVSKFNENSGAQNVP